MLWDQCSRWHVLSERIGQCLFCVHEITTPLLASVAVGQAIIVSFNLSLGRACVQVSHWSPLSQNLRLSNPASLPKPSREQWPARQELNPFALDLQKFLRYAAKRVVAVAPVAR